jgi:adenylate cyclase
MNIERIKRKLTAIMSADVKDYSRLMGEDEIATIRTLKVYRDTMANLIQQHNGRVVDAPGDNILAEFPSVIDAVQGAVAIQRELKLLNASLPDNRKMEFRMGITLGDVIVQGEQIYGDDVNIAAGLEGLSEPGGICISWAIFDHIEGKLPFTYEYLGEKPIKNIDKSVPVYRVLLEPEEVPMRSLMGDQIVRFETGRHNMSWIIDKWFGRSDWLKRMSQRHGYAYQSVK